MGTRLTHCLAALSLVAATACHGPGAGNSARPLRFEPAPGSPIALGPRVGRPALADMDRDGDLDVVVPFAVDGSRGTVAVLLNDGHGAFRTVHPTTTIGPIGLQLAVGDVDGDGYPDVAVSVHDSYEVTLLTGDGRGGLERGGPPVVARTGNHPHTHSVALADVDGDGRLDLLTTNADHGDVSVLRGDGAGGFAHADGSPFAAARHPYEGLAVCDVDGDGRLDVVVPDLIGGAVAALLGDGAGRFAAAPGSPVAVGSRPGFVAAGDLDGDGRADAVATHDDDPLLAVLRGTPRGLEPAEGGPFELEERAWGAALGDVDGDGHLDLALGGYGSDVLVRRGDATGSLRGASVRVATGGRLPLGIALGDLDGDGRLDIVTGNFDSGDVSVLLNR